MTRRVAATSGRPLEQVMQALYPAASITGAPKERTMEIIAELESSPRRIYTGSVGFVAPDGREVFNVAIRTALVDRKRAEVEYGVGSGIVWDSEAESEYDECFAKASVVTARADTFDLFETILWEAEGGYFLLERHIARLRDSCRYFGWSFDEARVRRELDEASRTSEDADQAWRVRLHLDRRGGVRVEFSELHPLPAPYTVALARDPVDSESHSLFHKTTNRSPYDTAEPVVPGVHDVILWNEKGEVTESRIANIVLDLDGELVTPPVESGLLAGCYRAELLEAGEIQERRVLKEELRRARAIYLVNSLRKMWRVELAQS